MLRELEVSPIEALREPLRCCVEQFGQCTERFLTEPGPNDLADVCAHVQRLGGLFHLLGARRAAVYCTELNALLVTGEENNSGSARKVWQVAVANAVVRVQHFSAALSWPVCDDEIHGDALHFPLPDFLPRLLDILSALLANPGGVRVGRAESEDNSDTPLQRLISVLAVTGCLQEMRDLTSALVHIDLHFRCFKQSSQACTPSALANATPRAAHDYLVMEGGQQLVKIIGARLETLAISLARGGEDVAAPDVNFSDGTREFERIAQTLDLLAEGGMTHVISSDVLDLARQGTRLCRQMRCSVNNAWPDAAALTRSVALLLRIALMIHRTVTQEGRVDRHSERLLAKIRRDCTQHEQQWQHAVGECLRTLHLIDEELLACADAEIAGYLSLLSCTVDEIRLEPGNHHVGHVTCTVVGKLSMALLSTGRLAAHHIVEALREGVTSALENQRSAEDGLADVLALLCTTLKCNCDVFSDRSVYLADLLKLEERVVRWITRSQWACNADSTAVLVTCAGERERERGATIDVAQLPEHLASNIRELLFCAENIAAPAMDAARFAVLNRRLIIELRMLATGARALHVHRVARLSTVLAEVHQRLAVAPAEAQGMVPVLVTAHRQLRSGLNQAAARQEVSSNRDVIAALYQWLEASVPQQVPQEAVQDPVAYAIFTREAEELMGAIQEGAMTPANVFDVPAILHALHTLKGNASVFGCAAVATLCHRCEEALLPRRESDRLVHAVNEVNQVVYASTEMVSPEPGRADLAALVEALRAAVDALACTQTQPTGQRESANADDTLPRVPLASVQGRSVVVSADSLQRMAALAVTARIGSQAINDVLSSCRQAADPARLSLLADLMAEQERCIVQLDEEIAGSRQISFSRLTPRLQRLAGRHGNLLDRQLRFSVHNDALCADRTLVESLVAPLEHLLRNAIDHGIEPPSQRRARGKPDSGTIVLTLEEQERALVITMTDDGAGIDPVALEQHARRLNLPVNLNEGPRERLQWLFLPGFSSREHVTQAAGHGIGLAMVGSTVKALGGQVDVDSQPGQGSCFRVTLPR